MVMWTENYHDKFNVVSMVHVLSGIGVANINRSLLTLQYMILYTLEVIPT